MNFEKIKNYLIKVFSGELDNSQKIYISISVGWIIFVGYLTWWNGLRNPGLRQGILDGMNMALVWESSVQLRHISSILSGKKKT